MSPVVMPRGYTRKFLDGEVRDGLREMREETER
jgi:hypothetical protein